MFQTDIYQKAVGRRTIHQFLEKEVPQELVQLAVEAAVRAPNHKMTWPWGFVDIDKSLRESLAEIAIIAKGENSARPLSEEKKDALRKKFIETPRIIAAVQKLVGDEHRQKEDYATCACGIQNFSLVMWENGVGVKWSTGAATVHQKTYELLGVDPEKEAIVGFLWVGYPETVAETNRPSFEEVYRVVK